jgi:hypothetical protein
VIRAALGRVREPSAGPFVVAGLLSPTLFFAALVAAALATDRPRVLVEWRTAHGSARVFDEPTTMTEAKIWLLALAVVSIVLLAASVGSLLPFGPALPALAGAVVPWLLLVRLDEWVDHHTQRFPHGNDLTRGNNTLFLKGDWEVQARATVRELVWATAGIGTVALVTYLVLEIRRRAAAREESPGHSPAATAVAGASDRSGETP